MTLPRSNEAGTTQVRSDSHLSVSPGELSITGLQSRDERRTARKTLAAGVIGTVIEYFDFIVYATISGLVFGKLFFPSGSEFITTMAAWSTFAVGYLARPIGGIIFGHFGDKLGRRKVLVITMTLMGVGTTLIGILPTYAQIGVAAPIILILLRVVQGIGVGGEFGGAAVMIIENAQNSGKRGLFGALISSGSVAGFFLASALMAVLTGVTTAEQFSEWAWRVPFLLSSLLLGVGFYIRYKVSETPAMKSVVEQNQTSKVPLVRLFKDHPKQLIIALAAPFGVFAVYYAVMVFTVPFAVSKSASNASFLLGITAVSQAVYIVAILFGGWWSDRIGRRVPMLVGSIGMAAWAFAFFPLVLSGSTTGAMVAFSVALLFLGCMYGPIAAYLAELFNTAARVSGFSFGYQVSAALAGGLTPLAATALVQVSGGSWVPVSVMLAVSCSVTFVVVLASRERLNVDLSK